MESTGSRDKIQCSQATADLLMADGKGHWVKPRNDGVVAKGKGVLTTFWLSPYARRQGSTSSSQTAGSDLYPRIMNFDSQCLVKQERLVEWIRELLLDHLRAILAKRFKSPGGHRKPDRISFRQPHGKTALDEVAEVICLPEFNPDTSADCSDRIEISETVNSQLRAFITAIANMYHPNPFHNWEVSAVLSFFAASFVISCLLTFSTCLLIFFLSMRVT